ncbi:DDE_3 domain-containing protein [Trichonephila clavipes]|nr:DDE_3 domain-containing protein [Trichonephila clavipes]
MSAEFMFMYDNARPHRANIVDECLQSEDITRMDWPAYSPDLNKIEQRVGPPPAAIHAATRSGIELIGHLMLS